MGVSYATELKNLLVRRPNNFPQYVVGESYQEIWSFTNKLSKAMATIFFACVLQIAYMNIAEAQIKTRSDARLKYGNKPYITQVFHSVGKKEERASKWIDGDSTISFLALNSN